MTSALPADGLAALTHWHPLRARGADAATFLQGQLTNDVASMDTGAVRLAGYCSAKGRLQASFLVWRLAEDDFVLACATDVAAATLKRLSMFVLRAKCRLSDAGDEWRLFGACGAAASARCGDLATWRRAASPLEAGEVLRLPDVDGTPRGVLVVAPAVEPVGATLPLDAWRRLEVRSGIALIEAATVDRFVPQMINFEAIGGVDFRKGCYPGQEVVARSQYRGTIKRRAFIFDCEGPAAAGAEVYHETEPGQPAGMVVNAAPAAAGGGSVALVEVKLASLEGGRLHVGAPDGPSLGGGVLPYELPLAD